MADSTIKVRILSISVVLTVREWPDRRVIGPGRSSYRSAENSNGSRRIRGGMIPRGAHPYGQVIVLVNALLSVNGIAVQRIPAGLLVVDGLRPVAMRVDLYVVQPIGIVREGKPLAFDRADAGASSIEISGPERQRLHVLGFL